MKKRILLTVMILTIIVSSMPGSFASASEVAVEVIAASQTPTIDGVVESGYQKVFDFSPENAGLIYGQGGDFKAGELTGGDASVKAQGLSAEGYFTWDKQNLYFYSECTDNTVLQVPNIDKAYLATDNRLFIKGGSKTKEIRFINTTNGVLAILNSENGFVPATTVIAKIKVEGSKYSIEAKIPWAMIGIDNPASGNEVRVNLVQTSSKSLAEINSVVYSQYNWFGTTDSYFSAIRLTGTPIEPKAEDSVGNGSGKNEIRAAETTPKIDGIRDKGYSDLFDMSPVNAGLIYGQGGSFKTGELAASDNSVKAQGLSAKGAFTWDTKNLYFISECTDNTVVQVSGINSAYLATDNRLFIKIGSQVKEIRFINTTKGGMAIFNSPNGFVPASDIVSQFVVKNKSYTIEAKIPWAAIGIAMPKSGIQLSLNLVQTGSKSTKEIDSAVYSLFNWFGTADEFFKKATLVGIPKAPSLEEDLKNAVIYSANPPKIDGIQDGSFRKIFDISPQNAGLILGQGGDFPAADITGKNNKSVNAQGLSAKVSFAWDSKYLYFISLCTDNTIVKVKSKNSAHLATDNRLFFKNGKKVKEIRFILTSSGVQAIYYSGSSFVQEKKVTCIAKIKGKQYSIEGRIPWSVIGISAPKPGSQLKVNFVQTSSKSANTVNSVIYSPFNWFGTTDAYFETINLLKKK